MPSVGTVWYMVGAQWVLDEKIIKDLFLVPLSCESVGSIPCVPLSAGGDRCVHAYLNGQPCEEPQLSMLACFLVYHAVPAPQRLPSTGLEGNCLWALPHPCVTHRGAAAAAVFPLVRLVPSFMFGCYCWEFFPEEQNQKSLMKTTWAFHMHKLLFPFRRGQILHRAPNTGIY